MSTLTPHSADPPARGRWLGRALLSAWRGFVLVFLSVPALALFITCVVFMALVPLGVGLLFFFPLILLLRATANLTRTAMGSWSDVPIAVPYRRLPQGRGVTGLWRRTRQAITEGATWRDLLWALLYLPSSLLLACLPMMLIVNGLHGVLMPFLWEVAYRHVDPQWYTFIKVDSSQRAGLALPWGLVQMIAGLALAPWFARVNALWNRSLLAPTKEAELALRVQHLTESRTDAVDASAAELRRIERDLHDGAQARLVAMGMNLGAAEALLSTDPEAARTLLAETRAASAKALHELRDLVRGIHPPVLSDRGLGDAVRAVALESPLDVNVNVTLPARPELPLESAAYFAVTEVLTNAAKHSGGQHVEIDLTYVDGKLRITVTDDGVGGADLMKGTGLRGIERRLDTFDGTLALDSPEGGPTTVIMELPCDLSSRKTSLS
ncbi:sensor histidine kinase [Embleya scabrispora]|uniref:sensor histidine kinase n=1 Tax=Embleya scabrispora TaxID=159449 RepID=UPI00039A2D4C|nr:sensor histidine kinase [Embleya scabrispora]MYS83683.1 sensor histidine kinase [Streptomyces sp. SID5474]